MKGMRNIAPFGLRMPDDLREIIQQRAKENGRSMNSEILQMLRDLLDIERADKKTLEFIEHESNLKGIGLDADKHDYLAMLEQEDTFAAALLRETEDHQKRLFDILNNHIESKDSNKKPT